MYVDRCSEMSHLTELERWTVIAYRNEGKSFASIAEELGHSKSTVAQRFEETKSVGDRKRKRTRSKLGGVLGQEIEETMEGKVGMSTRRMAKKLRVDHSLPISNVAVHKFMHAEGLEPHSRPTCTPLTDSQKRKRVEWCERFKNKRVSWWRKVVFLDEKTFGATWPGNRKNDIVWGRKRTIIPPRGVQAYQPSVKVGVALCYEGKSRAYELPAWSGLAFNKMVRELVIPFSQRHFHGENVVLFQDNDPSHLTANNNTDNASGRLSVRGGLQVSTQLWRSEPSRESVVDSAHQYGGNEDNDACFVGGCNTTSDAKSQKRVPARDDQLDADSFAFA